MIGDTWEKDKLGDTWRETNDEKQMKANKKYTQSQKPLDSMKTNEVVNHMCVSEQQSFEKAGRQVDHKGDKNEPHHPGDCWETTSGKPHPGDIWVTTGTEPGDKWPKDNWKTSGVHICTTTGRQLGDNWNTIGRHLGDSWETSGRPHVGDNWELWETS